MFLANILRWWYGDGLLNRLKVIRNRFVFSADFFSIKLLLTTLFSPYRQISAGAIVGSLNVQVRAFFDRLLSRLIGALVRFFMIIFGLIVMVFQVLFGMVALAFWLVIPLFPFAGFIMMIIGWTPR